MLNTHNYVGDVRMESNPTDNSEGTMHRTPTSSINVIALQDLKNLTLTFWDPIMFPIPTYCMFRRAVCVLCVVKAKIQRPYIVPSPAQISVSHPLRFSPLSASRSSSRVLLGYRRLLLPRMFQKSITQKPNGSQQD